MVVTLSYAVPCVSIGISLSLPNLFLITAMEGVTGRALIRLEFLHLQLLMHVIHGLCSIGLSVMSILSWRRLMMWTLLQPSIVSLRVKPGLSGLSHIPIW